MPGRVIEVLLRGASLNKERGFLVMRPPEGEKAQIPLADISTLLIGPGVQFSSNLLLALHEQGATVVFAGATYHPAALVWPHSTHTSHCQRLQQQIDASQPLKKRLWQQVVRCKINQQALSLKIHTGADGGLFALSGRVRSGDPENFEAQAARRYWQKLLGGEFRRDPDTPHIADPNNFLNYGYAIIRAGMARAVSAFGLHPALGIHHHNQANTFALVDDLMEPYRPAVDLLVARLCSDLSSKELELTPDIKRQLAAILDMDLRTVRGEKSPLSVTMLQVAQSLCESLETGKVQLVYPPHIVEAQGLLI